MLNRLMNELKDYLSPTYNVSMYHGEFEDNSNEVLDVTNTPKLLLELEGANYSIDNSQNDVQLNIYIVMATASSSGRDDSSDSALAISDNLDLMLRNKVFTASLPLKLGSAIKCYDNIKENQYVIGYKKTVTSSVRYMGESL